jgi:serine/threonine-protein kinase
MIGQVLGQYRIVAELGHGSMGEVYRAVDEMLDRDVALKILRAELTHDSELAERFRREAITLARPDHQNIARLHGLIKHETKLLMVMEFVTGETLAGRLKRGRVPWRDAADLICQILAALDYAHSQGVVHRDIKPSNVMVRLDGRVKVMDFGIARVLGTARVTRVGHMIGTLEYMSPEQIRGEDVKASSDLYATGVLLYELLAGRMPFEGPTDAALIQQHLRGTVPPINAAAVGAPVWFEAVVTRALAKTPGEHFESAASFRAELDRLAATEATPAIKPTRLSESPTTASEQQPPTRLAPVSPAPARPAPTPAGGQWRWTSRHLVVAAAILTLLVAMAIVFGLRRTTPDKPPTGTAAPAEPQVTASLPTVAPTPEPRRAPDRPLTITAPAAKPAKAADRGGTPAAARSRACAATRRRTSAAHATVAGTAASTCRRRKEGARREERGARQGIRGRVADGGKSRRDRGTAGDSASRIDPNGDHRQRFIEAPSYAAVRRDCRGLLQTNPAAGRARADDPALADAEDGQRRGPAPAGQGQLLRDHPADRRANRTQDRAMTVGFGCCANT